MLGKSRARVHRMTAEPDFPAPIDDGDDHRHPIWDRYEVQNWALGRYDVADWRERPAE